MTRGTSTSLDFEFACSLIDGLHARPASQMSEMANKFSSQCVLTNLRTGSNANLKSVLAIISADVRKGDRCSVQVRGTDEQAAHFALRKFVDEVLPGCDVPLAGLAKTNQRGKLPRVLQKAGATCYFGVPVVQGIAYGKVVLMDAMALPAGLSAANNSDTQGETAKVQDALAAVRSRIRAKLAGPLVPAESAILQAELAMAGDVSLAQRLTEHIAQGLSAAQAVIEAGKFFISLLRHSDSQCVRDRALDVEEICRQIIDEIYDVNVQSSSVELREPCIVVVETLAPQQLLSLDRQWLKGLVLEHSGPTSHTVILARSLAIPTVLGVKDAHALLRPGEDVVLDASRGLVIFPFTPAVEKFYQREHGTLERRHKQLPQQRTAKTTTRDGKPLEIAANASSLEETARAFENGADGVGLFRTEAEFLQRATFPGEEEQFAIYAEVMRAADGKPVIFRTFDVGGDKAPAYMDFSNETNPFLGYRGIRVYGEYEDLLQAQLRAFLRASVLGQVQIMAPMVGSIEEVLSFKAAIQKARSSLAARGVHFSRNIPIGVMIEIPSAAFVLDQLYGEVDFFSIGTNDLSQYFLAADRENAKIAALADVRHPGFLRFLNKIVSDIKAARKWIGVCGEMAGEMPFLPLFLGLGVDEISVPVAQIAIAKNRVAELSTNACKELLSRTLACNSISEVTSVLHGSESSRAAQPLLSEQLVVTGRDVQNKEEALQELIDAFFVSGRADDRQQLEDAVWAREEVYSTGLGFGFATPHCKTEGVTADSIGILKLEQPIEWDAADSDPVSMVILIAIREPQSPGTHMQVFSKLARKLMEQEFRHKLGALSNPSEIVSYLAMELDIERQ